MPWWERRKFRLVAGQEDPLAFFLAEAVSHMTVAAFAAIDAITVTSELPAPALQHGQPQAQQQGQLTDSATIGHALIEDPQGRPATSIVPVLSPEGLNLF